MKDHAAAVVSDEAFAQRAERWPVDTPDTKEAYFIREIFQGTCARVAVQAFRGLLVPQLTSRPKPRPRQPYGESHQGLACSRVMGADGGLFFFFFPAGYRAAIGGAHQTPADVVSRSTTRHTKRRNKSDNTMAI